MAFLRTAFLSLSHRATLRRFFEESRLGARLNSRFVAGVNAEAALDVAAALNREGIAVTLDSLGESVTSKAEAHRAAEVYHQLLDAIAARNLNANVSVKLSQMGLEASSEIAESIVADLVQHARNTGNFVRIDMEDSRYTQITLDIVRRIHAQAGMRGAVGVVIQAYLYRSQADIEQLMAEGIRVRLCKGAYNEPPVVAFPKKSAVDANFLRLARMLLSSTVYHALATHDERVIQAIKTHVLSAGISRTSFEFQMLYGVRRNLQRRLAREGYKVRVYVPFGPDWYPYFMRRLAERPANLIFLFKNLVRG